MKRLKKLLLPTLLGILPLTASPARAQQWDVLLMPGSANADRTLRLLGQRTQHIALILQADDFVRKAKNPQDITLEFDVPPGFSIVHDAGYYKLDPVSAYKPEKGRGLYTYKVTVKNENMLGHPGTRRTSEWQLHSLFVETPASLPLGQNYIQVRLSDGQHQQTFDWPLALEKFIPPQQRARRTPIGLWDYNFTRAATERASEGIAQLIGDAGITFTQNATNPAYRAALKKHNITNGGNTHHDFFYSGTYRDENATGKALTGFADPYGIANLPPGEAIPGVKKLIEIAREGDNIATFDFEPTGTHGFNAAAVQTFRQEHQLSEADFQRFRDYVAKHHLQTHATTDPEIARIWKLWVQFRSQQNTKYLQRIYEATKAQAPDVTVAMTPSRPYGHDTKRTLAVGTDHVAMSKYVDIVMPQIYHGYGGAAAKLTITDVGGWRAELDSMNAKTKLWPLLLVRFAGAASSNSPQRVFQQSIGSIANGADGVMYYFPDYMDAPYWNMVAKLTQTLAKYEDFYHDGKRVDEQYKTSLLPLGTTQVNMWPGYQETVENPGWAFTAHELGNKVLLTLINLEEANDLVFGIDAGNVKYVSGENAEAISGKLSNILEEQNVPLTGVNQWLVGPGQVGFIVVEKA